MVLLLLGLLLSENQHRVYLQPLDFQDESNEDTFITGINQIESNGQHIFIVDMMDPRIIVINRDGQFIRRIGQAGHGPAELGQYAPRSIAAKSDTLWVLDFSEKSLHRFDKGKFQYRFRVHSYQLGHGSYVSPFAFNDTHILLPVYPRTGRLAALYDHKGKVEQFVGEIFPIDKEMLREIPALNDTLWAGDDSGWYCLFRYRPFIYRFDKNLKKVAAYRLSGPEIDACEYDLFEEEIPKNRSTRPEHFTDFKLHGEYLYLLCRGVLYQIDKHTGHWRNRVSFYGKGADFEETGLSPTERLNMTYMAFLDDGTMITAPPALMWNHDLWTVRLPFMK